MKAIVALAQRELGSGSDSDLQIVARTFARDTTGRQERWLRTSLRAHPVVGEHVGHFAAFLGQPFRQHDFYVGIYDGLTYAARELVCGGDSTCSMSAFQALATDAAINLGPVAPRVLTELFRMEYGQSLAGSEQALPAEDSLRYELVRAVLHAAAANRSNAKTQGCDERHMTAKLFCSEGFDRLLRQFGRADAVKRALEKYEDDPKCDPNAAPSRWLEMTTTAWRDCPVDETLGELVRNPDGFAYELGQRVLHQAWRVENARRDGAAETALEAVAFGVRILGYRERPLGVQWDPSTVQDWPRHWGAKFAHVLPYTLGIGDRRIDLGWRPTYYSSPRAAFVLPITSNLWWKQGDISASFEGGIWVKPPVPGISGAQFTGGWALGHQDGATSSLAIYFFADRAFLRVQAIQGASQPRWSVGVADLNGFLYWSNRLRGN
jgi:hypothetical protein